MTCRCGKEFTVSRKFFVKPEKKKKSDFFALTGFCNEMDFSPHPSYSSTQSLGQISPPLALSLIHGLLALTSHCSSKWHATLPGIQFIWAMYNHKPYHLQPGRLTQRGPVEVRERGGLRFSAKAKKKQSLFPVEKSALKLLWNVRGDSLLYLLVCLQIAAACVECWWSDCWAETAEKNATHQQQKFEAALKLGTLTAQYKRQTVPWFCCDNGFSRSCFFSSGRST